MRDVYHVQDDLEAEVDRKYRALGAHLDVVTAMTRVFRRVEWKDSGDAVRASLLQAQGQPDPPRLPARRAGRFEQEGQPVGNVQELFHGTKNCNMVGILSRGLLIAPKNAPVTGYMFGKGIYFADQSTKSAQYSLNVRQQPPALRLPVPGRCRPGEDQEGDTAPQYREEAPDGYHSVQGCKGPCLIHNEFIIYKTAQCTLRYIAEIEQA